jgi:hypothetical protein
MKGLDTKTPYIQVGDQFYRGEWADLIGTEMIVEKKEGEGEFLWEKIIDVEGKVIGMTRRRLLLQPITLKPKTQSTNEPAESLQGAEGSF